MNPIRLLQWFCKPEYLIDIEGDLLELHAKRLKSMGRRKAKLLLWRDVILLLRPGIIKNFSPRILNSNITAVIRHNLLISLRTFLRNKVAFFINLGSLTCGLVCALLIYLWVADEMSMDKFHENDEQLYLIRASFEHPSGTRTIEYTPSLLADALVAEMPEVERAVSMTPFRFTGPGIVSHNNKQVKSEGFLASDDFFKVFSYDLFLGDKSQTVISRSLAGKLFGAPDKAIGKLVEWNNTLRIPGPFIISGIFEDVPQSSTAKFDIVFDYRKLAEADRYSTAWNSSYSQTTLLIRKGTDIDAFNKKIEKFIDRKDPRTHQKLSLIKYSDRYLSDGRIYYVRLFSLVAIFTLAIACINFVNLSTAQASRKMKEVGVKKTFGVARLTLVAQFLSESMILAFISLLVALLITYLLLPNFNALTGKHLSITLHPNIILVVLITGIAAGIYPAFFLSGLKNKIIDSTLNLRKGLVIVQFTTSVIFITGFLIINRQIEFVREKNLGYEKENVITFQRRGIFDFNDYDSFITEIKNVPGVINASSMSGSVVNREYSLHTGLTWKGALANTKEVLFPYPPVAHDFVETMGIELKEGRTYQKDLANESDKMIVNESAVKMMGFRDPVGEVVMYGEDPKEIIGVVKDFKYGSLHTPMEPVFFEYRPININIVVRLQPGYRQNVLEQLQAVYSKYHPGYPFEFSFIDDDYNKLYEADTKVSKLSTYFAVLATLISCLGLFGLAVFSSERRMKEIGIRKVLGATTSSIVRLLSNDLVKPVFLSVLFATPLSFAMAREWLDGFAYRIELSLWFFLVAGVTAILLTWATVGFQTFKAANRNPVNSLKSE